MVIGESIPTYGYARLVHARISDVDHVASQSVFVDSVANLIW
jgi:hypothetical protein